MEYYKSKIGLVRDAKIEDVFDLKKHLKEETVNELMEVSNFTPEQSLIYSHANSILSYSVVVNDDIYAMGGIYNSQREDKKRIWFLSSTKLQKIETVFLRQCRNMVKKMLEFCPVLYSYVNPSNDKAILWLKWIGAELGDVIPCGKNKVPLMYFEFKK